MNCFVYIDDPAAARYPCCRGGDWRGCRLPSPLGCSGLLPARCGDMGDELETVFAPLGGEGDGVGATPASGGSEKNFRVATGDGVVTTPLREGLRAPRNPYLGLGDMPLCRGFEGGTGDMVGVLAAGRVAPWSSLGDRSDTDVRPSSNVAPGIRRPDSAAMSAPVGALAWCSRGLVPPVRAVADPRLRCCRWRCELCLLGRRVRGATELSSVRTGDSNSGRTDVGVSGAKDADDRDDTMRRPEPRRSAGSGSCKNGCFSRSSADGRVTGFRSKHRNKKSTSFADR